MYEIELADGTKLKNLELNGNNFISSALIDDAVFENNLDTVTITDPDGRSTEYHNMKLVQNKQYGNEWWFILAEKTGAELEKERMYGLIADLTEVVLFGGAK